MYIDEKDIIDVFSKTNPDEYSEILNNTQQTGGNTQYEEGQGEKPIQQQTTLTKDDIERIMSELTNRYNIKKCNKIARLKTLGMLADFIDFFQFKVKCTSKQGGAPIQKKVQMISLDNKVYNVPKTQENYFSSIGFKKGGFTFGNASDIVNDMNNPYYRPRTPTQQISAALTGQQPYYYGYVDPSTQLKIAAVKTAVNLASDSKVQNAIAEGAKEVVEEAGEAMEKAGDCCSSLIGMIE
jgi:hypothetical protein